MRWATLSMVCIAVCGALLWGAPQLFVGQTKETPSHHILTIADVDVKVKIARTHAERERGLSGSPPLGQDEGMLFIFPQDGRYSFWMKDMLFPIDILWLSEDGTVVHLEKEITPQSFPESFTSDSRARYVLEVSAGFSDTHGITKGTRASIPEISSF